MYKPKKIAQIKISATTQKNLRSWLIEGANRAQIVRQTDLSKSTLLRYIKKIKTQDATIEELFTLNEIQTLIKIANEDYATYQTEKLTGSKKAQVVNLSQQEKLLKQALHKEGWSLSTEQLDFAKILRLSSGNLQEQQAAKQQLATWPQDKQQRYLNYQQSVTMN